MKCLLCPKSKIITVFQKDNVSFLRCCTCDLTFLEKKISSLDIYKDSYFNAGKTKEHKSGYSSYLADRAYFDSYFKSKLVIINKYRSPGRILDVGCAYGLFLVQAEQKGWQPFGIEPSKKAADYAKKNFDLNIFNGPVEKAKYKANYFDAVVLFQTAEHLVNPLLVLKKTNKWLKKGGLVMMTTLNEKSLLVRVVGKYWPEYKAGEHNYYFSFNNMRKLLLKAGFGNLVFKKDIAFFPIKYILERFLYHANIKFDNNVIINKIGSLGFFKKPLVPLYLGGMIVVAKKK